MISKWFELKNQALDMRRGGTSLRVVEKYLKIPRSTLSGWFKNVKLTDKQKSRLRANQTKHLGRVRKKAILWHNLQKKMRIEEAECQADNILSKISTNNPSTLELAASMLYLGEGLKTKSGLGIGNSDPIILKFFITLLVNYFHIDIKKIKCTLHLRADQDSDKLKLYWSKELGLSLTNFNTSSIDKRTIGSPTYSTYNGVCVIHCGNIAIQRRLIFLSKKFCQKISQDWGG